jgi:hypothetical protein
LLAEISIDSTQTPQHPMYYKVKNTAAQKWNAINVDIKEVWKEKAGQLKSCLQMDGTFENVPSSIKESSKTDNVLQPLSQDCWVNLV